MSRPEIIKELKEKNPKLSQSELETVIDIFCQSIEDALKEKKTLNYEVLVPFLRKKLKKNTLRETLKLEN